MKIKKALVLGLVYFAWGPAKAASLPVNVYRPYFLKAEDKIPNIDLFDPGPVGLGPRQESLALKESINQPDISIMKQLAYPELFEEIKAVKHSERDVKKIYWHQAGNLDYCHTRDQEGNHWYGWVSDGKWSWVLWKGKRYWWRDSFAGHWLYYYQGYWWRADGQNGRSLQVLLEGEYYSCDGKGTLLKDMGQDGKGAIVSEPGRYKGDFRHGGGPGGHNGNHSRPSRSSQPQGGPQSGGSGNH